MSNTILLTDNKVMTMMKVEYEKMTPEEFSKAVGKMPVFIVLTGLLEWHGDHLPLGQDTLKHPCRTPRSCMR